MLSLQSTMGLGSSTLPSFGLMSGMTLEMAQWPGA